MSSIDWLIETPLYHPSVVPYSILLQGRTPEKVVLSGNGCDQAELSEDLPIADWDLIAWGQGWFNMDHLKQNLTQPQQTRNPE
jgi:hypothetical protein